MSLFDGRFYLDGRPSSQLYLYSIVLRQLNINKPYPQKEDDCCIVITLKDDNLNDRKLVLEFEKARWLRDALTACLNSASFYVKMKATPGDI